MASAIPLSHGFVMSPLPFGTGKTYVYHISFVIVKFLGYTDKVHNLKIITVCDMLLNYSFSDLLSLI